MGIELRLLGDAQKSVERVCRHFALLLTDELDLGVRQHADPASRADLVVERLEAAAFRSAEPTGGWSRR
ncbi:MAG: hypothetical protein AAFZ18_16725 [Myxococcota bacterium]